MDERCWENAAHGLARHYFRVHAKSHLKLEPLFSNVRSLRHDLPLYFHRQLLLSETVAR